MNDIWMNNPIPDARYLKFKVSAVKQLFLHDMERLDFAKLLSKYLLVFKFTLI